MKLKSILKIVLLLPIALCSGCNIYGLVGSESISEQKVPAQFKIAERGKTGVLVLVDQGNFTEAPQYLRAELNEMINILLVKKARINQKNIITADPKSPERLKIASLAHLPPEEIAAQMNVETVLYVRIVSCRLSSPEEKEYYHGSLSIRCVLLDNTGQKLWPADEGARVVRAQVELETAGRNAAVTRLAKAAAHCAVRNLYNCPRTEYNIMDEQREYNSGDLIF